MSVTISPGLQQLWAPKKASLDWDGKEFILAPPRFPSKEVKIEAQAKWDGAKKLWRLPDVAIYAHTVLDMYPDLPVTERASERLTRDYSVTSRLEHRFPRIFKDNKQLKAIWDKLYVYQQEEIANLILNPKLGQEIVLSPGLGKTIVSMMAARLLGAESVMIVAIKDLLTQWQDEEEKWFGTNSIVKLHGEVPEGPGWCVVNYDTVVGRLHQYYRQWCADHNPIVIVDESVLIANRKTRRFKNLLALRPKVDRWWNLSGSPARKGNYDLWAQMHVLEPESFRSFWRFAKRYNYVEQGVWGTTIGDDRDDKNPADDLKDLMFVRNQKDVLKDLPDAIPQLVKVGLKPDQLKAYREMHSGLMKTILDSGKELKATIVLAQLIRLQQITSNLVNLDDTIDSSAKADALMELIEANAFEYPAIVWTNWVPGARSLYQRLKKVMPLNAQRSGLVGETSVARRVEWIHGAQSKSDEVHNEEMFRAYKRGEIDLLVLALPVGKFGHNLQNSRTVIYYDKTWNGDDFVQSMHRVIRIGLDHKPLVITLKCENTTDEMIEDNIAGKLPSLSKLSNADLAQRLRVLTGVPE